jgi:hypothetical protein
MAVDQTTEVIVTVVNACLLWGCVWVWRELTRRGVNGACHLCIALLAAERLSDWRLHVDTLPRDLVLLHWAFGALFAAMFLHALYHVGVLVAVARGKRLPTPLPPPL